MITVLLIICLTNQCSSAKNLLSIAICLEIVYLYYIQYTLAIVNPLVNRISFALCDSVDGRLYYILLYDFIYCFVWIGVSEVWSQCGATLLWYFYMNFEYSRFYCATYQHFWGALWQSWPWNICANVLCYLVVSSCFEVYFWIIFWNDTKPAHKLYFILNECIRVFVS